MLNTRFGCSLLTYQLKETNSTNQIYPRINLMLRYTPSANNVFSLNFNTGNSFPSVNTLNDVEQSVNEYMIKKGIQIWRCLVCLIRRSHITWLQKN